MADSLADVTLHIDEETSHDDRESFRDELLDLDGVVAAAFHDELPHLVVIAYNPEIVNSRQFVTSAKERGLHAELVGL